MQLHEVLEAAKNTTALLALPEAGFAMIANVLVRPLESGYSVTETKKMVSRIVCHGCDRDFYLSQFLEKIASADRAMVATALYHNVPARFMDADSFGLLLRYTPTLRKFPLLDQCSSLVALQKLSNVQWEAVLNVLCHPEVPGDDKALGKHLSRVLETDDVFFYNVLTSKIPAAARDTVIRVLYESDPETYLYNPRLLATIFNFVPYDSEVYTLIKTGLISKDYVLVHYKRFVDAVSAEEKKQDLNQCINASLRELLKKPELCAARMAQFSDEGADLEIAFAILSAVPYTDFTDEHLLCMFKNIPQQHQLAFLKVCHVLVEDPATLYPKFQSELSLAVLCVLHENPKYFKYAEYLRSDISLGKILSEIYSLEGFLKLPRKIINWIPSLLNTQLNPSDAVQLATRISWITGNVEGLGKMISQYPCGTNRDQMVLGLYKYIPEYYNARSDYMLFLFHAVTIDSEAYKLLKREVIQNYHFLRNFNLFLADDGKRNDCKYEYARALQVLVDNPVDGAKQLAAVPEQYKKSAFEAFVILRRCKSLDDDRLLKMFEATAPEHRLAFLQYCSGLVEYVIYFYKKAATFLSEQDLELVDSGEVRFQGVQYLKLNVALSRIKRNFVI